MLLAPLLREASHLVFEGFAVVFLRRRADVAAGGEDVAVLVDFVQRGALAEAGDVGVGIVRSETFAGEVAVAESLPSPRPSPCKGEGEDGLAVKLRQAW